MSKVANRYMDLYYEVVDAFDLLCQAINDVSNDALFHGGEIVAFDRVERIKQFLITQINQADLFDFMVDELDIDDFEASMLIEAMNESTL